MAIRIPALDAAKDKATEALHRLGEAITPKVKEEATKLVDEAKSDVVLSAAKVLVAVMGLYGLYSVVTATGQVATPVSRLATDGARIVCSTYNEVHQTYNIYGRSDQNG